MENSSNGQSQVRRVSNVRVAGISSAVPTTVAEVSSLAEKFGEESIQKIISSTGVKRRHVVVGECTSDLCVSAAVRLFEDLSVDLDSITTLVFVSQTHDYALPATACVLQERLGLPVTVAAFDVALGCSGYVYGLWLAGSLLSANGGGKALLLVGDTISKMVSETDRSVAALFGDAGTATLLEYDDQAADMRFILGSDGRGAKNLIVPGGGFRDRKGQGEFVHDNVRTPFDLYMNGAEIFSFTLARIPALVNGLLKETGYAEADIQKFVFHQANRFMLEHLGKRMKLPAEKFLMSLENYGNTSSASIPLALSTEYASANSTANGLHMLVGFGVGYSWGACIIDFDNVHISPVTIAA
ncbi:ketoacyl-ACP synthase III [Pseudomonas sp. GV071]|uniref:ketoacyl-ACP synthase III n=1 Tax=Pseudomonas sp. GV071 TaxID=2135754 RepID=UPI000D3733F6|nr:ketoacyl-ACP synthase III [Pseudomonas sp. GV071]PTQ68465.1 3-oxoacyl-[acyl-carrier-protein] synthase-3 [Pseudomonas sp. GV071]